MITLPITEKTKEQRITIVTIAKNNVYPVNTIKDLRTKLMAKKYRKNPSTIPHNKK